MKVFLTGATGYIGSAVAEALLAAGHSVSGLARSIEAEQTLKSRGLTPLMGDFTEPKSLLDPVHSADAVISTATTNDDRRDAEALYALRDALKGTGKPFVYTSGVWVLGNTGDTPADESAPLKPPPIAAFRPGVEKQILQAKDMGVRSVVIRPGVVYGRGAGLAGLFVQSANETGAARYIGDGSARWTTVHVEDLADLYVRAVETAAPGSLYHGTAGDSIRVREIAEAASFGAGAGGATQSWPVAEASKALGVMLVEALLLDQVVSSAKAQKELGWSPKAISLLEDLRYGSYAMARINP